MTTLRAALLALLATLPLPARAEAPQAVPAITSARAARLDEIIQRGTLRVGTTGDYKPFSYRDPATGRREGFDVDLAENLAKALGVKVEFVPTSWPNLSRDFGADAFDMAAGGVSVTLDRAKRGFFSAPYMREGKTPIARCADKEKFATIANIDRPGVRVVVNPGGTNEKFARANVTSADIRVHPDNTTIFKEIAEGRADVMMTDASETRFQQKETPGLCAIHPDQPFSFAEKAFWLQRDPALKEFVDQWLHLAREDGTYRAIYAKWFE